MNKPWYRHLMVWLIMLPPAAAVVSGVTLLYIAAAGGDPVLRDDYVKIGMTLEADSSRDAAARALGLGANVHLLRQDGRVTVVLRGPLERVPDNLTLRLLHPTDGDQDRSAALERAGNVWQADLRQAAQGRWLVQIEPTDRAWRLAGELAAEASAVTLGKEI